jgi:enoyl-CoA hydratase/carnithine racemase
MFLNYVADQGKNDNGRIQFSTLQNLNLGAIRISNPQKRNCISGKMMNDLAEIVDQLTKLHQNDKLPLGLIVYSDGDIFCSGADLNLTTDYLHKSAHGVQMYEFMNDALNTIRSLPTISVCIINGPCIGGGAELATSFDYRIMKDDSSITFVHCKLGITPSWGSVKRLFSVVKKGDILRIIGTSAVVKSDEAKSIGLIDDIYSDRDVDKTLSHDDQMVNIGVRFFMPYTKQRYPKAVQSLKRIISHYDQCYSRDDIDIEKEMVKARWRCDDNIEAVTSVLSNKGNKRV